MTSAFCSQPLPPHKKKTSRVRIYLPSCPAPLTPLFACLWGTKTRCDVSCLQAEGVLKESPRDCPGMAFWKEDSQIWIITAVGNSKATFTAVMGDHRNTTASLWVPLLNINGYKNSPSIVSFPPVPRQHWSLKYRLYLSSYSYCS